MEGNKFLCLNNVHVYKESFGLANYVWGLINKKDYFIKQTIGPQFVRAIDSISANVAEGFGRYSKKEKIRFYIYARGSIYESLDWLEKCRSRHIIKDNSYSLIYNSLIKLPYKINLLIKCTNSKLKK